jgi:hypothetical protein
MKIMCEHVALRKENDKCRWLLEKKVFAVKSLYLALKSQHAKRFLLEFLVNQALKSIWLVKHFFQE